MEGLGRLLQGLEDKNADGTLVVGEAMWGYYRLRSGVHAGRIVIKCRDQIDGKDVVRFANGLTWCWLDDIKDVLCERVCPTFSAPAHPVDYSESTWYPDNSDKPMHYEW